MPWRLEIAGPLGVNIVGRHRDFFSNPRVECVGRLSRKDLAQAMSRADVFVFPSLAEGSARVIFEALACGCYVITTPNSGSIVEGGVHGSVVPPGDSCSLAGAIEYAFHHRAKIAEIGRNNAQVVRDEFTQRNYGNQLTVLYKTLLVNS
jgi:glycosyltransferase involved in cell wall biosynthesis